MINIKKLNLYPLTMVFVFMILLGCAGSGNRRHMMRHKFGLMPFSLESFNLASESTDKSRLHINIDVPYSDIQFERTSTDYEGGVDVSFTILHNDETEIVHDVIARVNVDSFATTTEKKRFERISKSFNLAPGNYEILVSVTDKNSQAQSEYRKKIRLKDFKNQAVAISDIMLFDQQAKDKIAPEEVLAGYTGIYPKKIFGLVQIYTREPHKAVDFSYRLLDPAGKVSFEKKLSFFVPNSGEWVHFELERENLQIGLNKFEVQVTADTATDKTEKMITFRWQDAASTAAQLEQAIEQLRYLAPKDKLKEVRKEPEFEKRRWFDEFWKSMDPDPATPENDLKDEYYTRVNEATQRFAESETPGWQTDRGRIYIIHGPPDYIRQETSQHELLTKYEIWYYERLKRKFVFRDTMGGRYWLIADR